MLQILLALKNPDPAVRSLLHAHRLDTLPEDAHPAQRLAQHSYHLVLADDDPGVVEQLKAVDPRTDVILFGQQAGREIDAVKRGATAYFSSPIDLERLKETLQRIHDVVEMRRETAELEKLLAEKYTFAGIVGRNPQMLEIISLIRRIAPYYRTVLITGETGTGKEVLARALHQSSPWAKQPFLVCNCGALVEHLIESELFGHVKGSFTGAIKDKAGLFEAAGEGTLFLDEIGELPLSFQPRLLRVLQDGEFRRVGSTLTSQAKCKVIAATNRNLEQEVENGRFREDLYFRITPFIVKVPPLRDRKDDLLLLCRFLLDRFNQTRGKRVLGISRPAQAVLMAHDWPGNVRELENVLEQAAVLTVESFIRLSDLPGYLTSQAPEASALPTSLLDVEKRHIAMVLGQCRGNRTRAAEILGISRRALIRKINKFGMA
ncbi:MAG: sigma-54 dependent transcriptional regulator [Nitrospirota bacterium]